MQKKIKLLIKTTVSITFIVIVLSQIDLSQTWQQFRHMPPLFIIYALVFYTCLQWLSCIRWQIVLVPSGHSLPSYRLMANYFGGMFLNNFLPGSVGGDVYRVYRIAKDTQDSEIAMVSVFLERFTGLAALSAMAIVGLVPAFELIGRWDIICLFLGCVVTLAGGTLIIANTYLLNFFTPLLNKFHLGQIVSRMAKIQVLLHQFAQHQKALIFSTGLSFFLQFAIVYYHYLVAQQLGISISFLELLVFIPIIVVVTMLPISLGGIGLKEGLWVYLFTRVGQSAEEALLLSLTIMVLSWLLSLPGALIILMDSTSLQSWKTKSDPS
ncbi:MAG: lysylphosphatidylglycerol synthase transmembrane domain-containing protein [Cyanobacteria bacterium P01_F01_bin.116]